MAAVHWSLPPPAAASLPISDEGWGEMKSCQKSRWRPPPCPSFLSRAALPISIEEQGFSANQCLGTGPLQNVHKICSAHHEWAVKNPLSCHNSNRSLHMTVFPVTLNITKPSLTISDYGQKGSPLEPYESFWFFFLHPPFNTGFLLEIVGFCLLIIFAHLTLCGTLWCLSRVPQYPG